MQVPSDIDLAAPVPGSQLISPRGWRYHLGDRLGSGAFGSVFEGTGPFDQRFAIKVLRPANRPYEEVREEWLSEARRLWELRHPNIVYIHEVFESAQHFYLVLERCDHSLAEMLGTPFSDSLVVELSRQLLFGLAYLHANDVVHNDVHAGNVLVVQGHTLTLKFSDFGIAQDLDGRGAVRPSLVNNRIMAPEVARGGNTTTQSDLYQLGLLMYEMHAGESAVDAGLGYEEMLAQVHAGVPRARAEALGTPLGKVISVLLRRHEQYRYTSPSQVWDDLRQLTAEPFLPPPTPKSARPGAASTPPLPQLKTEIPPPISERSVDPVRPRQLQTERPPPVADEFREPRRASKTEPPGPSGEAAPPDLRPDSEPPRTPRMTGKG